MKKQLPRLLILAAIIIAAFYLHDHSFSSQAPSDSPEKSTKASDRTVFVRTIPLRDKPRSPRSTGDTVENRITSTSVDIQSTQVSNEIQIGIEQVTNNFDLTTTPHPANVRETTHFQESLVGASSQDRFIRFLPLGDKPPHREQLIDGIRQVIPPPEGSLPPKSILVPLKPVSYEIELGLSKLTDYIQLPGGQEAFELFAKGKPEEPWLVLKQPKTSVSLAIMLPKPKDDDPTDWHDAIVRSIPDDLESFPHGSIRIINMGVNPTAAKLGDSASFLIPGGKTRIVTLEETSTNLIIEAKIEPKGTTHRVLNRVLEATSDQRTCVILYTGHGTRTKGRTQAHFYQETHQDPQALPEDPESLSLNNSHDQ